MYSGQAIRVVFIAPPGSGKGTQAQMLEQKFNIRQLSTGDMLREKSKDKDALGKSIASYIGNGSYAPDDVMIAMLGERITQPDCINGFILDGFPRTMPQVHALDYMLVKQNMKLDHVIELVVDDAMLIERVSGRFTCGGCNKIYHDKYAPLIQENECDVCHAAEFKRREDDKPEILVKRLQDYHAFTRPLLAHYAANNLLRQINGMNEPEVVAASILQML